MTDRSAYQYAFHLTTPSSPTAVCHYLGQHGLTWNTGITVNTLPVCLLIWKKNILKSSLLTNDCNHYYFVQRKIWMLNNTSDINFPFKNESWHLIGLTFIWGSQNISYLLKFVGCREQINDVTSFIDASNVYGSNERKARDLRTFQNGGYFIMVEEFKKTLHFVKFFVFKWCLKKHKKTHEACQIRGFVLIH